MSIDEKTLEAMLEAEIPAGTTTTITEADVYALMGAIADVLKEYIPRQIAPIVARLETMEKTVAKLTGGPK